MKMQEALAVIGETTKTSGYMVHFERLDGRFLVGDYFPDKHAGEPLIETEEEAWKLAKAFASRTRGKCVNLYVTGENFVPVPGYKRQEISNRL